MPEQHLQKGLVYDVITWQKRAPSGPALLALSCFLLDIFQMSLSSIFSDFDTNWYDSNIECIPVPDNEYSSALVEQIYKRKYI